MTTQPTPAPTQEPDAALRTRALWHLDPWHTAVHFAVLNRGAGRVRGRFVRLAGTVKPDHEDLTHTEVDVTIEAAGITTGVAVRDTHLRSGDFLDVEHHPVIRFAADRLVRTGPLHGRLEGRLDLLGRSLDMAFAVRWEGSAQDAFREDAHQLAFCATGEVSLRALGLGQDLLPGLRVPGLGDTVRLTLDVVLLPYDPAPMLAGLPVD